MKTTKTKKRNTLPAAIKTVNDVKQFFDWLLLTKKVSFHPDDDFKSYVNTKTGKRTFTNEEAKKLNGFMNTAFTVCGKGKTDIYEIGLKKMMKLFSSKSKKAK